MKIMICASVSFAKEMIEAKEFLDKKGHKADMTSDIVEYFKNPSMKESFNAELKWSVDYDVLMESFNKIKDCDAVLILNYDKKGIKGYLGTSVLMEIAVAYANKKKLFLLNPIDKQQNYVLELEVIKPKILNGNLELVK